MKNRGPQFRFPAMSFQTGEEETHLSYLGQNSYSSGLANKAIPFFSLRKRRIALWSVSRP